VQSSVQYIETESADGIKGVKTLNRFKGSEEEFELLMNKYKGVAYGTAYAYLRHNYEVDDVVQEAFIQLYFNYETIRDKEKIGSWICGVTRNISLKKLRSIRYNLPLDGNEHIIGGCLDDELCDKERNKELYKAINNLSKPIAETVTLYYLAEKSVNEISSLLSVPEGTVKSRLYEGRKKLKGDLIHMMEKKNCAIKNIDVYKNIKEYITNAKNSVNIGNHSAALLQLDSAIEKFKSMEKEYRLLAEIYRLRSIAQADIEKAISDGEKSVAYARLTNDKKLIAECMMSHAFDFCDDEKALTMLEKVYKTAESIGHLDLCAESAYWIATKKICKLCYSEAKKWLNIAISDYDKIEHFSGVNCCIGDTQRIRALAIAALDSMNMLEAIGRLNGEYSTLNTFCLILKNTDDGITSQTNYGWDIPGKQKRLEYAHRFFGCFECEQIIYNEDLIKNGFLDYEYYLYNGILVNRRYDILSRNETIVTEAGELKDCLHIKIVESIPGYDESVQEHKDAFESLEVLEHWYCPHVGLVKSKHIFINDSNCVPYTRELKRYSVSDKLEKGCKYFPISVGDTWEYSVFDENGANYAEIYGYRDCYRIDKVTEEYIYISNSGFTYRK